MTRTEALCIAMGWQGGTVHQVAAETGLTVSQIVGGKPQQGTLDGQKGWFAARTCSKDFFDRKIKPEMRGNFEFWCGVADAAVYNPDELYRP